MNFSNCFSTLIFFKFEKCYNYSGLWSAAILLGSYLTMYDASIKICFFDKTNFILSFLLCVWWAPTLCTSAHYRSSLFRLNLVSTSFWRRGLASLKSDFGLGIYGFKIILFRNFSIKKFDGSKLKPWPNQKVLGSTELGNFSWIFFGMVMG